MHDSKLDLSSLDPSETPNAGTILLNRLRLERSPATSRGLPLAISCGLGLDRCWPPQQSLL